MRADCVIFCLRSCVSALTVKYCEHLEEYETFPLHFLHQKVSNECTSHVRERPSLCLQFEQGVSQANRPNHASPRRQSWRSGTTGLYRRAGERRQTWSTDRTLRTQRYLVDSTFCESAFYENSARF